MKEKTTPGKTSFQKFQALAKGLMQVSKSEVDKKIRDERMKRKSQRDPKRSL